MKSLAQFCYQRRRLVVIGWIVLLFGLLGLSSAVGGEYNTDFKQPDSESARAVDLLQERGLDARTGFQGQIVFKAERGVNDPAVRRAMEDFFAKAEAALEDEQIVSPYLPQNAHQISQDGKVAYAEVNLSERDNKQYLDDGKALRGLLEEAPQDGVQVELGGDIFAEQAEFANEVIGIGAAIIILLIAFGSLLAMGLPIVTALFGIGCGFGIIGIMTRFLDAPDFSGPVAAMIGIGVGIDYSLLIVSRYRQALHDGLEPKEAVALALDTSGRAVVFAGITVVISLLGIFLMNLDFMRAVAVAGVSAVAMTMLAAVTLLPALLGFTGRNIDRLRVPLLGSKKEGALASSFWYRWSRIIQARPWPALIISAGILIVLAAPLFSMRLGFPDAGNRLETDTTRRAYDLLSTGFGPGFNGPILMVIDTPGGQADLPKVQQIAKAVQQTEGVASVVEPQLIPEAKLALVTVFPASAFQDEETKDLVHRLRKHTVPPVEQSTKLDVYTSGGPPFIVDFSDYMGKRLPYFIGAVLVLSFLLLLIVFHLA